MRRWLVPVAAAAVVLVLLAGVLWVADTGSGGDDTSFAGGSGREPGTVRPSPGVADPEPVRSSDPMAVVIEGYRLHDDPRRVSIRYYIGVPECYGTIRQPKVEETPQAVRVTLTRKPPAGGGAEACIDIALLKAVDIRLDAPLGDRLVLDGAVDDAVVSPVPDAGPAGQS
jgi:hypothetical protein